MHTTDTSPATTASRHAVLYAALAGFSLLVALWSAPGLAAAHMNVGCDPVAGDLKTLDAGSLAIKVVDLSDASATSPENPDGLANPVAPLLFLTPRVASILEDVFGDSDTLKPAEAVTEKPAGATKSSPVVENAATSDAVEPVSPMYENGAILPRFQRQMYRTDI